MPAYWIKGALAVWIGTFVIITLGAFGSSVLLASASSTLLWKVKAASQATFDEIQGNWRKASEASYRLLYRERLREFIRSNRLDDVEAVHLAKVRCRQLLARQAILLVAAIVWWIMSAILFIAVGFLVVTGSIR